MFGLFLLDDGETEVAINVAFVRRIVGGGERYNQPSVRMFFDKDDHVDVRGSLAEVTRRCSETLGSGGLN